MSNRNKDINGALCRLLGIDGHNVTDVVLTMRAGGPPCVKVTSVLLQGERYPDVQMFKLEPIEHPAAFDLDGLVAAAQRRLAWALNVSVARHHQERHELAADRVARLWPSEKLELQVRGCV